MKPDDRTLTMIIAAIKFVTVAAMLALAIDNGLLYAVNAYFIFLINVLMIVLCACFCAVVLTVAAIWFVEKGRI